MNEYEGVEDDEEIANHFGNLLINTHDNYIPDPITESFCNESEQFYTSIGQLQGS